MKSKELKAKTSHAHSLILSTSVCLARAVLLMDRYSNFLVVRCAGNTVVEYGFELTQDEAGQEGHLLCRVPFTTSGT